jgi:hypothetical protein
MIFAGNYRRTALLPLKNQIAAFYRCGLRLHKPCRAGPGCRLSLSLFFFF